MDKRTKYYLINKIKDEYDKSVLEDILLTSENDQEFEELIEIQAASTQLENWKSFDSSKAWNVIQKDKSNTRNSIIKYAAIVILLLSVGMSYLLLQNNNEFQAGNSNKHIVLQDGSDIILYPNAVLKVSNNFNRSTRKVFLKGDAYFNVAKKNTPFVVDLHKGSVDVLGTVFYINQNNNGFKVDLISGKVNVVDYKGNLLVLGINESAIVEDDIKVLKTISLSSNSMSDLKLDNVTINDAINILNNIYGKNIIELEENSSDFGMKTIHTTVRNSSVREFINGLKLIFDVRVINSKGKFIISES